MDLEEESFDLAEAIMADVALTQRVLRTVNSAFYAAFGQNITGIKQAIVVLGYQAIGNMALALKLSTDLQQAAQTKDSRSRLALARSSLAGTLAREITRRHRVEWAEEAGVYALMNRLGSLLLTFYLPDQWDEVEATMEIDGVAEDRAVYTTLGLSASTVGQAVARHWRLPERLVASLKPGGLQELRDRRAGTRQASAPSDWLENVVKASNELSEELVRHGKSPDSTTLATWVKRFCGPLGLGQAALIEACQEALRSSQSQRLSQMPGARDHAGA
jgi:HD-like signal output (HDOD) protein